MEKPKCQRCGKPVRLMRNRFCSKSCSSYSRPNRRPGNSWSGLYRKLRQLYPEVRIKLFYERDFMRLAARFGLQKAS